MAYTKTIWNNDTAPKINATNLNNIEDGIESVDTAISNLDGHLVNVAPSIDEDYKVNLLKGKNLFDKSNAKLGYEITSDTSGSIGTNSSWFVTPYIQVTAGEKYYVSNFSSSLKCFYDSGKTFVESSRNNPVTVPANAKYMVMNGTISSLNDDLQIEKGDQATTYEPYITPTINVDGEDIYKQEKIVQILSDTVLTSSTEYALSDSITNYKYLMFVLSSGTLFENSNRQYVPVNQLAVNSNSYRVAFSVFQSTSVYMFVDLKFNDTTHVYCGGTTKGSTGWTAHIKIYGIK